MARNYGGISVKIDGEYNNKDIKRAIADLKALDDNAQQTKSKFGAMSRGVKLAGAAIAAAAATAAYGVVKFAGQSIGAASDLEESLSKVRTVFGDASGSVESFAKDAAVNLGLSEQAALEATGTFGNLFTAMGINAGKAAGLSTEVVQLAADLASFNNIDVQEAITALRSGLVGETEPLRRLGVNLSAARIEAYALESGLVATKGQLDAATKAQAAWALITQDAATASGDFARTSDGLANTQRILRAAVNNASASVGKGLVIALQDATRQAGGPEGLANAIENVGEEIGYMVRGGATVVQYLDDLADGFNQVAKRAGFADEETDTLGKQLSRLLSRGPQEGIKVIADALADLGREQEAAAAATAAMANVMSGSVKPADHLADSLSNLRVRTDEARNAAAEYVAQTGVQLFQIQAANKTYRDAAVRAYRMAEDTREAAEATDSLSGSTSSAASSVEELTKKQKQYGKELADRGLGLLDQLRQNAQNAREEMTNFAESIRQGVNRVFSFADALNTQQTASDRYARTQEEVASATQRVTDAAEAEAEARARYNEVMNDSDSTASQRQSVQRALADAVKSTATATRDLTAAQQEDAAAADEAGKTYLQRLQEQAGAAQDFLTTIITLYEMGLRGEALAQIGGMSAEAGTTAGQELIAGGEAAINESMRLVEATDGAAKKVAELTAAGFFGTGVKSAFETFKGFEKEFGEDGTSRKRLNRLMDRLAASMKRETTITVTTINRTVNEVSSRFGGFRANGGPVSGGSAYVVGERGPELFVPDISGTVISNADMRSSGTPVGGVVINVTAGLGTDGAEVGRQIVEALSAYERRNGKVYANA